MIIYMDEEHAYRYWITRHRHGYVLAGTHVPKLGNLVLHRAICEDIKSSPSRATYWTTDGRLKACSLKRSELEAWATIENGLTLSICPSCQPGDEVPPSQEPINLQLPKLGRDVLDYIVESALIHLEWSDGPPYRLSVTDVANCVGKTVNQVTPVLRELITDGFVWLPGVRETDTTLPSSRLVLPTPLALRPLPGFSDASFEYLQSQIDTLLVDHS